MKHSLAALLLIGFSLPALAAPPVTMTAEQDHQNMMNQLNITTLRAGPSGDEKAPNHANYDDSKANPYPNWPDVLTLKNGQKVTTPAQWQERRAEIIEDFNREVLGRVPVHAPKISWTVLYTDQEMLGRVPVTVRQIVGHADNTAYPDIAVNIQMTLVTPASAPGPVPVLMMFTRADPPAPSQPAPEELDRMNAALKAAMVSQDPSLQPVLAQHPAWMPFPRPPMFVLPQLNADGDLPNEWQLVAAGWGFARIDPASIQADNGAGLTRGVIGLANKGQPRKPDDWGALRAWAWGTSRGLDYLTTLAGVDARHIGIEGVSRYGKAALITMAYDPRFAMVLVGSSGEGGAKPHRRNFGEAVESLTGTGEYHWMAGSFLKYGGPRTPDDIPVDSHELIALCAPRLTFISYGIPEKGDARWLDHQGSYMAAMAAQPVWTLLGAKGFAAQEDYRNTKMPGVNVGLLDGQLAWRQHDGGHTDSPNMKYFIQWVDKNIGHIPPQQ
jgi:(4-O-methyl)-D-glucuronate---lignin esterase